MLRGSVIFLFGTTWPGFLEPGAADVAMIEEFGCSAGPVFAGLLDEVYGLLLAAQNDSSRLLRG